MKASNVIIFIVLLSVLFSAQSKLLAQENDQEAQFSIDTHGQWRLEATLMAGLGLDDHLIGKTSENKDITISGGGGIGGSLILGYCLTREFDLSVGFEIQNSSLEPKVENAEGDFLRTIIYATLKYRIPVAATGLLRFGVGAGNYSPGDLDIDLSKVSGGGHNIYSYESTVGFHFTAEYEGFFNEKTSWTIGLKYNNVTYNIESAKLSGISVPINILPNEIKDEIGELNGSGINLTMSLNLYLR